MSKHRAILIAGPTASGKSAAAVAIAERLDGVVINADSKQVYRDLHVLSARPSAADESRVPHALYGFVPAAEAYSAGRWLDDVGRAIADARHLGRMPIITGGTGLYFKALLEGLPEIPDIPETVRARWRQLALDNPGQELHAMLQERDPEMASRLRPSDPQRLVRALEVHDATGRSLAAWQSDPAEPLLDEEQVARIFVSLPRETLYERIDRRFEAMLKEGALDEVKALARQKLDSELPVMRALGVRPLMAFLAGELDREAAVTRAKTETRRYAKRQLTWAKSNMIAWNRVFVKDSESMIAKIFSFIDA